MGSLSLPKLVVRNSRAVTSSLVGAEINPPHTLPCDHTSLCDGQCQGPQRKEQVLSAHITGAVPILAGAQMKARGTSAETKA